MKLEVKISLYKVEVYSLIITDKFFNGKMIKIFN